MPQRRLEPQFLVSFMLLAHNLRDNLGKCFRMIPELASAIGAAARIFEYVRRLRALTSLHPIVACRGPCIYRQH